MKVTTCLEKLQIPAEFVNKTAFLFEVVDRTFIKFGIQSGNIALVDNSKELSTKYPNAFVFDNKTHVGLPNRIAEDLYYVEINEGEENPLLFSLHEISLIGQVRGVYRQDEEGTGLIFEKL